MMTDVLQKAIEALTVASNCQCKLASFYGAALKELTQTRDTIIEFSSGMRESERDADGDDYDHLMNQLGLKDCKLEHTRKLSNEDLLSLGYELNEDSDQPGMYYWRNDIEASDTSFASVEEAGRDAEVNALNSFELSRCGNCSKVHSSETLECIKDYGQRVDPGDEAPAGQCPDCGALSYLIA